MNILTWIQELAPAPVLVTMLILPWVGAALMHTFSMSLKKSNDARADAWENRAGAAVRWADEFAGKKTVDPEVESERLIAKPAIEFRIRRAAAEPVVDRVPARRAAALRGDARNARTERNNSRGLVPQI